jgi:hypothetical protein
MHHSRLLWVKRSQELELPNGIEILAVLEEEKGKIVAGGE